MKKLCSFLLIVFAVFFSESFASNKENFDINSFHVRDYRTKVRTAFKKFLKTKHPVDEVILVLGCGKNHRNLTVCNSPHDHEGAFTIDKCGGNLNGYGVTKPHVEGDILNKTLLSSLDREIFDVVKVEHINHCLLSSPFIRYQILREIFTLLKPGGTAIFLTGGEDHLYISLKEANKYFEKCGFQVQEASHYKKVPLCSLEIFNSYSDGKKKELVDEALSSNDRTYWRKLSEEEKKLYSDPIFANFAYFEIIALKPMISDGNEEQISGGSDDSYTDTEEIFNDEDMEEECEDV